MSEHSTTAPPTPGGEPIGEAANAARLFQMVEAIAAKMERLAGLPAGVEGMAKQLRELDGLPAKVEVLGAKVDSLSAEVERLRREVDDAAWESRAATAYHHAASRREPQYTRNANDGLTGGALIGLPQADYLRDG